MIGMEIPDAAFRIVDDHLSPEIQEAIANHAPIATAYSYIEDANESLRGSLELCKKVPRFTQPGFFVDQTDLSVLPDVSEAHGTLTRGAETVRSAYLSAKDITHSAILRQLFQGGHPDEVCEASERTATIYTQPSIQHWMS